VELAGKILRICQLLLNVGGGSAFNSQADLSEAILQGKVDTTLVNVTDGYL
jgi:hypothetical protein